MNIIIGDVLLTFYGLDSSDTIISFLELFDYWVKIFEICSRWYLKILEELLRKCSFGIVFGGK